MTRRPKSTKARRSANMEKALDQLGYGPGLDKVELSDEPISAETVMRNIDSLNMRTSDPLKSPQHRRALREAAKAGIREVVEKWLRMGADPEDIAAHLEGARVSMMDEARKRGKQG